MDYDVKFDEKIGMWCLFRGGKDIVTCCDEAEAKEALGGVLWKAYDDAEAALEAAKEHMKWCAEQKSKAVLDIKAKLGAGPHVRNGQKFVIRHKDSSWFFRADVRRGEKSAKEKL